MRTSRPLPRLTTGPWRHLAHRAAPLAMLAALAAPTGRADAQADCTAGTVASYVASGFSCRIGGYVLFNVNFDAHTSATGGAEVLGIDPLAAIITPFVGTDAAGRTTFGLDLADFTAAAGAHGTTHGLEQANASGVLGFWLAPDLAGVRITEARVHGAFDGFNATSERLMVESVLGGSVQELTGSEECLAAWLTEPGRAVPAVDVGGACAVPLEGSVAAIIATESWAARDIDGIEPLDGFSAGSLTRIEFTQSVVPEPATVTLVAGGLLALLGVTRVRSRTRGNAPGASDDSMTQP